MTKDLRLKIYPAVIGVLGVCLVASLFANVQVEIDRGVPPTAAPPTVRSPIAPATPVPSVQTTPLPAPTQPLPSIGIDAQGKLRVNNQTIYPLRVALLHQQAEEAETAFSQPVHWDFAPNEGGTKGLILSLPNQTLEVQPGDILVAFAQDGSRRYWGPYVVGKTSMPGWNADAGEWQLILQP